MTSMSRRALLAGAMALPCLPAWSQNFPSKPVRWIAPCAAGGNYDLTSRLVGEAMGRRLAAENFHADAVFCSTAKRARETYALLSRPLRKTAVSFHEGLYMVSPQAVLKFIRGAPEAAG